jgi:membrane-associated phospholipid phosphatase
VRSGRFCSSAYRSPVPPVAAMPSLLPILVIEPMGRSRTVRSAAHRCFSGARCHHEAKHRVTAVSTVPPATTYPCQEVTVSDPHRGQRLVIPDLGLLVSTVASFFAFAAILVVVVLGGANAFDQSFASRAVLRRGTTVSMLAVAVTDLGSFAVVLTAAVAAITGLWVQTRQLWASAILASSVAATASLVTLLKIAVARPRPGLTTLIGGPARDFSFPSGHTTNGTLVYVLATLLLTARWRRALWRRGAIGIALTLALLIGASGVYLGYHWATDVLAGWLLAAGVIGGSSYTSRRLELADRVENPSIDSTSSVLTRRTRPHHLV